MSYKAVQEIKEDVKKIIFGYRVQINTMGMCCFQIRNSNLNWMTQLDITVQYPELESGMYLLAELFEGITVCPLENQPSHEGFVSHAQKVFENAANYFKNSTTRLDDVKIFTSKHSGMMITVSPVIRCSDPEIFIVSDHHHLQRQVN